MAHVERWNTDFQNLGQSVEYHILIKEEGWAGGTTPILNLGKEPLRIRNRGNKENTIGAIIGTEYQFSFWITEADGTEFDDLFQADQRKYLIEIKKDAVLFFTGYMKPENVTRNRFLNSFAVTISLSDRLSDLKNKLYVDSSGDNYTGRVTILEGIKRALFHTGLEIDIKIKLGYYEKNEMIASDNAMKEADFDSNRYYKIEDGVLTPRSCYVVLAQLLAIMDCSILQSGGVWHIFNNAELDSYIFEYDWATLTQQSRVAHDSSLAIDAYKYRSVGQSAFRPPVSDVAITYENKFIQTNIISNGDFSGGLTGWTNGGGVNAWDTFSASNGELTCIETGTFDYDHFFISGNFTVTELNQTDKFLLSIRSILDNFDTDDFGLPPLIYAIITNVGTTDFINIPLGRLSNHWATQSHITIHETIGTGNHTIKIVVENDPLISNVQVRFDTINLVIDYGEGATTTDQIITLHNTAAVDELKIEHTTRIGDSLDNSDEGVIRIGGVLSKEWRSYGAFENLNLIDLLGIWQLNSKQNFTEYLRLAISDPDGNVTVDKRIILDGIRYRIVRYNKKARFNLVDVDLLEINT